MSNSNCIVVPLYKPFHSLAEFERAALDQLYSVLGKHIIYLVGPNEFDWTSYVHHAKQAGVTVKIQEFDQFYFSGLYGYNHLLLSLDFFKRFKSHEHMLIYQTDAWVFSDELDRWSNTNYDYIGAPWFEGWDRKLTDKFIKGGNGGFSLRNIKTAIRILSRLKRLNSLRKKWYKFYLQAILPFKRLLKLIAPITKAKRQHELEELVFGVDRFVQEDYFWSNIIPSYFSDFHLPEPEVSLRFSFELNPALLLEMNGNKLPFGCHAWMKYNESFWREYIKIPKVYGEI